jgi:hypothetical protein
VLAIQDPPAALEVARHITDPWYRCQALANAAEHIGERKLALRVLQRVGKRSALGPDGAT